MAELTPEEKRRIYEEEKVRLEAEEKSKPVAQKDVKKKKTNKGCLIIILVIAGLYAIYFFLPKDKTYHPSESIYRPTAPRVRPSLSSYFDIKVNKFVTGEYGNYEVIGEVTNTSSKTFHFVQVKAQFLNKAGTVVGEDMTYVTGNDYLMPGETKSYKLMGDNQPDYKSVRVVFDDAMEVK